MIRALTLLFLLIGAAAQSADVVVRTGEHGNFTRIFLSGEEATTWQLEENAEGFFIELPHGTDVDLTNVFDRINRARIEDIEQSRDGLAISLNCECGMRSFPITSQGLVVDISEQFPLEQSARDPQATSAQLGQLDWKVNRSKPKSPNRNLTPNFVENLSESQSPSASMPSTLVSEVAAAATQGGLLATQNFEMAGGGSASEELAAVSEQIRLSRDAFNQRVDLATREIEEAVCEDRSDFSIASWGNADSIYSGISTARRNLIDEAGQVDLSWLRKLVLSHIYAGQGREAHSILSSFPSIENNETLSSIARLVELNTGSASYPDLESSFFTSECHIGLTMWRVLSGSELDTNDKNSALAEFSSLPAHLRSSLGPALIDAFVRDQDMESARLVRSSLDRLDMPASLELKAAYARMYDELGEAEPAKDIYNDILQAGEVEAPKVAVRLVEMASEGDGTLSKGTTELIDALSFEYQGTDDGRLLTSAMIKGLILEERLYTAIDEMSNRDISEPDQDELEQLLFSTFSAELTAQELVNLYVHNPRYFLETVRSEPIRTHVGRALADAGFALQAQKLGIAGNEASDAEAPLSVVNSAAELATSSNSDLSENLVVRGAGIISQSKSAREDIASLLSLIR